MIDVKKMVERYYNCHLGEYPQYTGYGLPDRA